MRMTRLRRRVLRRARSRGGASNKYTLRKVLQLGFRKLCFLKDSRVRNAYVFWQAFCGAAVSQICIICFRRNTQVEQAFANVISQAFAIVSFRKPSQAFASMVSQCFHCFKFRNVSQALAFSSYSFARFRKVSQGFARFRTWTFARIRNGHFADGPRVGTQAALSPLIRT